MLHLFGAWPLATREQADSLVAAMTATRAVVVCERRTGAVRARRLLALAVYQRARLVHAHEPSQLDAAVLLARRLSLPLVATGEPGDPVLSVADLVLAQEPARELGARAAELEEHYLALLATGQPARVRAPLASLPTVGVVVVTHQRRDLLIRTLDALAAQTYPRHLVDVVVVDNGTSDGTSEVLARADVRVLREQTNSRPAAARNRAAALVRGDVLAFTDDDCRPTPTWLENLVAGFGSGIGLVQGRTIADPDGLLLPLSRTQWTPAEFGLYETCNIAYLRETFEAVGGFDEDFADEVAAALGPRHAALPFGEDTDLGWRVRRTGAASRFCSTAVVHHHVFGPDPRYLLQRASLAAAFPVLVRRTPELREVFLWRRVFLGRARLRVWAALLGGAAAVVSRSPAPAAATLPYLWSLLRPHRPGRRQRLRAAPVLAARDALETVALVRGSIRARSPVL